MTNNAGDVAYLSTLTATADQGVWVRPAGGAALVSRSGATAPETGTTFHTLDDPILGGRAAGNAVGALAFRATIGAGADQGIWTVTPSGATASVNKVASTGGAAPGTGSGVSFTTFNYIPQVNASGQVAFAANLGGTGVTAETDVGIWIYNPTGGLSLVVREGDILPVAAGDFRRITALSFGGYDPTIGGGRVPTGTTAGAAGRTAAGCSSPPTAC